MVEDFHSYLCYFCNQDVYVVKISGDFYNFWRGLGVKTCKKWSKIKKSGPIFRIIVSVFVCYKCELLQVCLRNFMGRSSSLQDLWLKRYRWGLPKLQNDENESSMTSVLFKLLTDLITGSKKMTFIFHWRKSLSKHLQKILIILKTFN